MVIIKFLAHFIKILLNVGFIQHQRLTLLSIQDF